MPIQRWTASAEQTIWSFECRGNGNTTVETGERSRETHKPNGHHSHSQADSLNKILMASGGRELADRELDGWVYLRDSREEERDYLSFFSSVVWWHGRRQGSEGQPYEAPTDISTRKTSQWRTCTEHQWLRAPGEELRGTARITVSLYRPGWKRWWLIPLIHSIYILSWWWTYLYRVELSINPYWPC